MMLAFWQEGTVGIAIAAAAAYLAFRTVRTLRRRRAGCCDTGCTAAGQAAGPSRPRFVPADQIRVSGGHDDEPCDDKP